VASASAYSSTRVGKFVTKDVNYFYRPAIAIIYVSFVALFMLIRWLSRSRFTTEEATLIALESLQRAAIGALSDERRAHVLNLLQTAHTDDPLARSVRALLEHAATAPNQHQPLTHRISQRLAALWTSASEHRLFRSGVFAALIVAATISAAELGWLLRDGIGHLSFSQRAFALTTIVADLALLIGATRLSRSLLSALHWYEHAVLLEITVAQIFLYSSEQLAATLNLIALLLLWSLLRWAIHYETAHHAAPNQRHPPTAVTVPT
jgi:hypothetical protein